MATYILLLNVSADAFKLPLECKLHFDRLLGTRGGLVERNALPRFVNIVLCLFMFVDVLLDVL